MKKYLLFSIIVLLSLLFLPINAKADTHTVPSPCGSTEVNNTINAAHDGDTVQMTCTGTASWGSSVNLPNNKKLTLVGPGEANLTVNCTAGNCIVVDCGTGKQPDISGFTINGNNANTAAIRLGGGPCVDFRIHNMTITNFRNAYAVLIYAGYGDIWGLIDHVTCIQTDGNFSIMESYAYGDWASATLGSRNAVFIEDSTLNFGAQSNGGLGCIDGNYGWRGVFRHNTVKNCMPAAHAASNGTGSDPNFSGTVFLEIYSNTFEYTVYHYRWIQHQGAGESVVYNNRMTGRSNISLPHVATTNYRSCCGVAVGDPNSCGGGPMSSRCTGSNPLDSGGTYGYPCLHQLGTKDDGIDHHIHSPAYQWDNIWTDTSQYATWYIDSPWGGCSEPSVSDHLQLNRDVCNGTTTMPPSCGGHANNYTPYTYPHPLRSETPQTCTYTYSAWGACQSDNTQTRTVISSSPSGCTGTPILTQSCVYTNFLPEQYIEAENGTLSSPMQIGLDSSASGGRYIYTPTDYQGSASYTFNVTTAGQYLMQAKVNNNNDGGQNSFYVGLDGEAAQGNDYYMYNIFPLATGFSWDNVSRWGNGQVGNPPISEFDPMLWDLSQGLHTFTFYGRESNTWLDQIILKRVDTTPPAAPSGVTVS